MAYTHKNLADVNDSAAAFGFEDIGTARFANHDLNMDAIGLSFHRLNPSKRQAFGHRHADAEEVYVVVGGSGRVAVGADVIDLKHLDAIRVSPDTIRAFEAGPEGLEIIAFGQLAGNEGSEMLTGWWAGAGENSIDE